jgi:hypothetical protein
MTIAPKERNMNMCTLKSVLEVLTALSAIGAAGWWFAAAWISRLPPISIH